MTPNVAPPAPSAPMTLDPTLGTGIGVRQQTKINPSGQPDKTFAQTMLETNAPYHAGIFTPVKGRELTYSEKNPYFRSYINFGNHAKKWHLSAAKTGGAAELDSQVKTDASGAFSKDKVDASVGLGIGMGTGSLGVGGALGMLLGTKKGPLDPVTGQPTAHFGGTGWLSNMILKEKYDGVAKINAALSQVHKYGNVIDVGDIFKFGPHSFVRKPGEYAFYGNMSAIGLTHDQLHGISALEKGLDPTSYNWRDGTGTEALAYGNGGAYRLDGRHVDYNGQTSSGVIGTMESSTWASMVNRHFYGNGDIARDWLNAVKPYQTFMGNYDAATLE